MIFKCTNAYYFRILSKIGGIESHFKYLALKYDCDMVIFYKQADPEQLHYLKQFVSCVQLTETDVVECENLFCCFNREILDQCKAKKKYLVLHGDYKAMVEQGQLSINSIPLDERIDQYLGVSQIVCDSWEQLTGKKAELVYNPIVLKETKPLMFLSATRLSVEKGWGRMKKLAQLMDDEGINYTWFIYTNSPKEPTKNMVFLEPRYDIADKMGGYDAYIQLSDNEGYCLSIVEALTRNVPVIVTDLPVLKELGVNKNNSVIVPFDMENVPLDEIKNIDKKKFTYKPIEDRWSEYLDLKEPQKVKVEVLKDYTGMYDLQLGRHPELGEQLEISITRYSELMRYGEKYNKQLVRVI